MKRWLFRETKPIFKSKWLSLVENSYLLPNGQIGREYMQVKRKDYVVILAFDDDRNILIEKQYRRGVDDYVYELPAGLIDEKETPEEAAEREVKEETGYLFLPEETTVLYPQPAWVEMKAYIVIGRVQGEKGKAKRDFDEEIDFDFISLENLKEMLVKGELKDMSMLAALGYYQLNNSRYVQTPLL